MARPARSLAATALLTTAALLTPATALAQLRWDVGAQAGVMKRITTGGDPGAPSPGFGPAFQVQGHVALLPMIRVGLYLAQDTSPASGIGPRTFWEGGLHARFAPPLLSGKWRTWLAAGFGYAYTYASSYHARENIVPGGPSVDVPVTSVDGGLLEIPLAVGLGYKATGPFTLFVELGGRFGVGFFGAMYRDGASGNVGGASVIPQPFMGQDSFALSLSVGLSLDE
ncbi:MAG TPA: hypothetical protein VIF15_06520 [Polyangiaceae bacterium]|jgi:hypothetical protein